MSHSISVKKLRELLTFLGDDDELYPNAMFNLAVVRRSVFVGYIDCQQDNSTIVLDPSDLQVKK